MATAPHCLPLGCCTDPQSSSPAYPPACTPALLSTASGWTPPPPRIPQQPDPRPLDLWIPAVVGPSEPRAMFTKADEGTETLRGPGCLGLGFISLLGFMGLLLECHFSDHRVQGSHGPPLARPHLPPQDLVILVQAGSSHLLIDFLVIQGPALSQKHLLGAKTCSDHGHRCPFSTWRLRVTRMREQGRAGNWRCHSHLVSHSQEPLMPQGRLTALTGHSLAQACRGPKELSAPCTLLLHGGHARPRCNQL